MRSAITVSLVPQARGGPFVLWDDLPAAFQTGARLGFDAIEIFPPSPEAVAPEIVAPLMERHSLKVAAVGTGGGWVAHKWHFTHPDATIREKARDYALRIVDAAAALGAPAIVGSMQGKAEGDVSRPQAILWLGEALELLGERAAKRGQTLFYEPLNRYETNLFNRVADTVEFLGTLRAGNITILADMFHMNIEEASIAGAIRDTGALLGHFHFADSNRRAVGSGHTEVPSIVEALHAINYSGYVSGEVFPLPDSETAAAQTMESFRRFFRA